jgi:hypothetical protein
LDSIGNSEPDAPSGGGPPSTGDFRSNGGDWPTHFAVRRNRFEFHITLDERLDRFDLRARASLGHEPCDIFPGAPPNTH